MKMPHLEVKQFILAFLLMMLNYGELVYVICASMQVNKIFFCLRRCVERLWINTMRT